MTQQSAHAPSTFEVMAESAEQAVPCADLPIEQRVEAVLMVADRPMSESRIGRNAPFPLTVYPGYSPGLFYGGVSGFDYTLYDPTNGSISRGDIFRASDHNPQ